MPAASLMRNWSHEKDETCPRPSHMRVHSWEGVEEDREGDAEVRKQLGVA